MVSVDGGEINRDGEQEAKAEKAKEEEKKGKMDGRKLTSFRGANSRTKPGPRQVAPKKQGLIKQAKLNKVCPVLTPASKLAVCSL